MVDSCKKLNTSIAEKLKLQHSLAKILLELHSDTLTWCYSSVHLDKHELLSLCINWTAVSLNHRHMPLAFKVTLNSTLLILSVRVIHI